MSDEPGDGALGSDARALLRERLALVRQRFVAGFDGKLNDLIVLARIVSTSADPEASAARQTLARGLHSLAGAAPTIGLTALGAAARRLETELAEAASTGDAPRDDLAQELMALRPLAHESAA